MTTTKKGFPGLAANIKDKLIQQSLERKFREVEREQIRQFEPGALRTGSPPLPEEHFRFNQHPGYRQLRILNEGAARMGVHSPFFKVHDGIAGAQTTIEGRQYINFASYDYLGMSGAPEVINAAKAALDKYGTSVSASRLVAGERPIHRELEQAIAAMYEVDDAIVFVSGHATNVSTIGHLFGPRDLVLHDELIHNSVLQGIQLSGARRLPFGHNDWRALDHILDLQR